MELSDRIKQIRKRLALSQLVFSQALGISRSHISNIETGTAAPSEQLINLICITWGINKNWLVNGRGELMIKYKSCLSEEEDYDSLLEDMIEFKYNNLFNNLKLLSDTINTLIEHCKGQALYITAIDDFILNPEHQRNDQIIKEVEKVEENIEGLKKELKKIKELKSYNGMGKIVPVSEKDNPPRFSILPPE
jgi:transcriptional regulator with XRE-family HTH domain